MGTFIKGARLGAGLVGLGYGLYRLNQGNRDWVTTSTVTAGLSMTLSGLTRAEPEPPDMPERIRRMMDRVDLTIPMAVMRALR
ncbi:MAG TPA: hypothetical protein VGK74_21410 [Symbiobacteriaceae bacterium]|jgi:hypothetical protein